MQFLSIGTSAGIAAAEIQETFDFAFNHTKEFAKTTFAAVGRYIRSGVGGAAADAAIQLTTSQDKATQEFAARIAAIVKVETDAQQKVYDSLFGEKKKEAGAAPGGTTPPLVNEEAIKGLLKLQAIEDAAFKAHTTALNRAAQSDLEIQKSAEGLREQIEKSGFERGLVSLQAYFDSRRAEIEAAGVRELAALQQERENEVKAEARATAELAANQRKGKTHGGDTIVGQEFNAAAAKNLADQQRARQAIADLDTKIAVQKNANETKLSAEEADREKAKAEQKTKLAAFQKTISDLQGKTAEAAKIEADAKEREYRVLLASQKGATAASIDAEIAKYRELTTAAATFEEAKKAGEQASRSLADERALIEDQVKSGQIFQIQADEKLEALAIKRLPLLQAIADAQLKAATATGNQANIQQAQDFKRYVTGIGIEANQAGVDLGNIKKSVQGALAGSFETFFTSGITGARSLGQAFAGLADGIVSSLQQVAAQMLTNLIMAKLFKAALSGGIGLSGGGGVGDIAGGFDEGGFVSGPGGTDVIPARLTAGEFVLREEAVRAIGPQALAAMNRGLHAPLAGAGSVPRFAEGGLVEGSGKGDPARIHLQLALDEGIVLKHMRSRAAGKVVVEHLANNPKQAAKAIGRST